MSTPDHDHRAEQTPSHLLPTPLRDNGRGGKLRTGNPGDRGGRGRPHRSIIVRASQDLERELGRLEQAAKPDSREVTCPCGCRHAFRVDMIRGMDARTRIAYAQLLAAIKASDPDAGEPPTQIMVTTGTAAEVMASVTQGIDGVVLVDGTQLEPT